MCKPRNQVDVRFYIKSVLQVRAQLIADATGSVSCQIPTVKDVFLVWRGRYFCCSSFLVDSGSISVSAFLWLCHGRHAVFHRHGVIKEYHPHIRRNVLHCIRHALSVNGHTEADFRILHFPAVQIVLCCPMPLHNGHAAFVLWCYGESKAICLPGFEYICLFGIKVLVLDFPCSPADFVVRLSRNRDAVRFQDFDPRIVLIQRNGVSRLHRNGRVDLIDDVRYFRPNGIEGRVAFYLCHVGNACSIVVRIKEPPECFTGLILDLMLDHVVPSALDLLVINAAYHFLRMIPLPVAFCIRPPVLRKHRSVYRDLSRIKGDGKVFIFICKSSFVFYYLAAWFLFPRTNAIPDIRSRNRNAPGRTSFRNLLCYFCVSVEPGSVFNFICNRLRWNRCVLLEYSNNLSGPCQIKTILLCRGKCVAIFSSIRPFDKMIALIRKCDQTQLLCCPLVEAHAVFVQSNFNISVPYFATALFLVLGYIKGRDIKIHIPGGLQVHVFLDLRIKIKVLRSVHGYPATEFPAISDRVRRLPGLLSDHNGLRHVLIRHVSAHRTKPYGKGHFSEFRC